MQTEHTIHNVKKIKQYAIQQRTKTISENESTLYIFTWILQGAIKNRLFLSYRSTLFLGFLRPTNAIKILSYLICMIGTN